MIMKTYKCGINPESNVHLVYRGGCEKPLTIEDAYRCTGCNQRFHKDCILEHFKQEKDHDWGRADERQKVLAEVEGVLESKKQLREEDGVVWMGAHGIPRASLLEGFDRNIDDEWTRAYKHDQELAELRAKLVEMKGKTV